MRLKEIYDLIDREAPFALSDGFVEKFGCRDNSGILLDCGREIEGVLFSLDCSLAAAKAAVRAGANCMVTHHPAIWNGLMRLTEENTPALAVCVREGISVVSAHLNLDAAQDGIDECLMRGLGGKEALAVCERLVSGGYGRVYDVPPQTIAEFRAGIAHTFRTERTVVYGTRPVRRVASFCGAGFDEDAVSFALAGGADTFVSSDAKHHLVAEAVERGLNVVLLTHYAAENYGFVRFAERVKVRLTVPATLFTDERLL